MTYQCCRFCATPQMLAPSNFVCCRCEANRMPQKIKAARFKNYDAHVRTRWYGLSIGGARL